MNSERIPIIIGIIQDIWLDNPDLHLMQLLINILSPEDPNAGLNLDDQLLLEKLRAAPERQNLVAKKLDAEIARVRPHAARLLGRKAT